MPIEANDPFDTHFALTESQQLAKRIESIKNSDLATNYSKSEHLGRLTLVVPTSSHSKKRKFDDTCQAIQGLPLKKRLTDPASKVLRKLSPLQSSLAPYLIDYEDVLYCARSPTNVDQLRQLTALHGLNHVFKTRDRILKNNGRLTGEIAKTDADSDVRDQGFTRPKVLVLLETRQHCVKWIDAVVALSDADQQENRKRFQETFVTEDEKFGDDRPDDFRELFEGNDDNDFRLGLKFTRKTIKYFSQFYSSDMILASPLGLRRAIKADDPKKMDSDFLSSIEICIVDQADAMLMQNWEHVEFVFEQLNKQPQNPHDCDFSRVRQWYLDGNAQYLRQTIVFSAYLTPELNALFNLSMHNVAGKVKIQPEYQGSMTDMDVSVRQTFCKYSSSNPAKDPERRFDYFTSVVMPSIAKLPLPAEGGLGVLIFMPNYYDFVRVRNFFAGDPSAQDLRFGTVSEYTELKELQRARSHFLTGKYSVLLYTGRAHHFRRLTIRGVRHVYLYGLPENQAFYSELVRDFLGASVAEGKIHPDDATCKALFSKWDSLALERIVGTDRVKRMLKDGAGDTFDFR